MIADLNEQMLQAAAELKFELAARLRDEVADLEEGAAADGGRRAHLAGDSARGSRAGLPIVITSNSSSSETRLDEAIPEGAEHEPQAVAAVLRQVRRHAQIVGDQHSLEVPGSREVEHRTHPVGHRIHVRRLDRVDTDEDTALRQLDRVALQWRDVDVRDRDAAQIDAFLREDVELLHRHASEDGVGVDRPSGRELGARGGRERRSSRRDEPGVRADLADDARADVRTWKPSVRSRIRCSASSAVLNSSITSAWRYGSR